MKIDEYGTTERNEFYYFDIRCLPIHEKADWLSLTMKITWTCILNFQMTIKELPGV